MRKNNSLPKRRVFALRRNQQQDTDEGNARMEAEMRRLETGVDYGFDDVATNGTEPDDSTTSSATSSTIRMRSRRRKTREISAKVADALSSPFLKLVTVIQFSPQPVP